MTTHYMSFSNSTKEYGPFDDYEKADLDRTTQVPIKWRTERPMTTKEWIHQFNTYYLSVLDTYGDWTGPPMIREYSGLE